MKIITRFLLSAVLGFFSAYTILNFSDLSFSDDLFLIILAGIMIVLTLLSLLRIRQIRKLDNLQLTGDEEDEAEAKKYKMLADCSLYANSAAFVSILAISMTIALKKSILLIIVSIIAAIVLYYLTAYIVRLMRNLYPERNLPRASDSEYDKKLLESADDGEKFVMLKGLYTSFNLPNILLIGAILFASIYSATSESSQVFSIIAMSVILLAVNGKYMLVIRKKQ